MLWSKPGKLARSRSEDDLERKLDLARPPHGVDPAEVGADGIVDRDVEIGPIEGVEKLGPELDPRRVGEAKILEQRQIPVLRLRFAGRFS